MKFRLGGVLSGASLEVAGSQVEKGENGEKGR